MSHLIGLKSRRENAIKRVLDLLALAKVMFNAKDELAAKKLAIKAVETAMLYADIELINAVSLDAKRYLL